MGNKLGCSCAPLTKNKPPGGRPPENEPWMNLRRRDGHLLRLWAEVFHVSGTGGAIKWQRVSEDLVPVNVTCLQDNPDIVFHITAYGSQVDKILDVRLVQPGTRLGQASECFIYWKDTHTGDTWGLNFTSPNDAKQFRECCKVKGKRKPRSTPSSPSRNRAAASTSGGELQCTCMTAENLHRARNGRVRYTGAATLPRPTLPPASSSASSARPSAVAAARGDKGKRSVERQQKSDQQNRSQSTPRARQPQSVGQCGSTQQTPQAQVRSRQQIARAQYASQRKEQAKSVDYSSQYAINQVHHIGGHGVPPSSSGVRSRSPRQGTVGSSVSIHGRSKSSDNVFEQSERGDERVGERGERCATACGNVSELSGLAGLSLDSNTLKRMLNPLPSGSGSAHSSPVDAVAGCSLGSQRGGHPVPLRPQTSLSSMRGDAQLQQIQQLQQQQQQQQSRKRAQSMGRPSGPQRQPSRDRDYRPDIARGRSIDRFLILELDNNSPEHSSEQYLYDNLCYATTPSSSNENSDMPSSSDEVAPSRERDQDRESPTSRLLQEYEAHLRSALARGLDAESYSLHTFEALLTQSMENVAFLPHGFIDPGCTQHQHLHHHHHVDMTPSVKGGIRRSSSLRSNYF